ncbi:hypothetical protein [Gelidibacter salicanalis]|uniref:Uncharacterized protein n=1 Tax=Gelidibacter salicanalis TaxID=291193 RepID=A0A934KVV7_9FLAO|nr:hypothetical protein [Gelidibacter salicanalis]MBJ7882251.1 hypothetical protein [Gelidibacter salicanalis]
MTFSATEEEKLRHPNYKIMDLSPDSLKVELNSWYREDLIEWLVWNDKNGVYRDEESLSEIGNILGKDEAISIIIRQIFD